MIELNNLNSRIAKFKLIPDGKAPLKHGRNILRFSDYFLCKILIKRNWILIKITKNYQYIKPPDGIIEPFEMTTRIPHKEFVLELARNFFEKGESCKNEIGEWPLIYAHNMNNDLIEYSYDKSKRKVIQKLHKEDPESFLLVGSDIWSIEIKIKNGNYQITEFDNNLITNDIIESSTSIAESVFEGKKYEYKLSKYERNKHARKECLKHYGMSCQICGFNFHKFYGHAGSGCIHVHHIKPISERDGEHEVDYIKDLIPVCANCHLVIHSKEPIYSIEEMKKIINDNKSAYST